MGVFGIFSGSQARGVVLQGSGNLCRSGFSSNSEAELAEKRRLYFEQGAQEVWICDDAGTMLFFAPAGQLSQSQLILEFPLSIEI